MEADHLSGGNLQKLVIARELSEPLKVLVAASPDARPRRRRCRIGARASARGGRAGTGVLLISEDLDEILELNDRILVMYEGMLTEVGDRENVDEIGLRWQAEQPGGQIMKIVVALGGNALLQRGEPPTAEIQRGHAGDAMAAIAELAREHNVVLTHGNGPQVGLLSLQASSYTEVPAYPLDVLGAESEGMIGYVLEQELENRLPGRTSQRC